MVVSASEVEVIDRAIKLGPMRFMAPKVVVAGADVKALTVEESMIATLMNTGFKNIGRTQSNRFEASRKKLL